MCGVDLIVVIEEEDDIDIDIDDCVEVRCFLELFPVRDLCLFEVLPPDAPSIAQ